MDIDDAEISTGIIKRILQGRRQCQFQYEINAGALPSRGQMVHVTINNRKERNE